MRCANFFTVWLVLTILLTASSRCSCEEPEVEIPLNKIWGYMIPGTQSIDLLESDHFGPAVLGQERANLHRSFLSHQIFLTLARQSQENQPIGPGFVVAGSGHEALEAVKEIMEQDQIPLQTFPAGTEVSLFFFAPGLGFHLQLIEVRQSKGAVTVCYRLASDSTSDAITSASTHCFALIPLGKPAEGNHAVNIVRVPIGKNHLERKHNRQVSKEFVEKYICKPFDFSIDSTSTGTVISK